MRLAGGLREGFADQVTSQTRSEGGARVGEGGGKGRVAQTAATACQRPEGGLHIVKVPLSRQQP